MTSDPTKVFEFSHLVTAENISVTGHSAQLTATADECERLAKRFSIVSISNLSAQIDLMPVGKKGRIDLQGSLSADVVQSCGVTLQPVDAHISVEFERSYRPQADVDTSFKSEESYGPEDDDPVEAIVEGQFDVGETIAEEVALALDPFPRAPGADEEMAQISADFKDDTPDQKINPFAKLADLKKKPTPD